VSRLALSIKRLKLLAFRPDIADRKGTIMKQRFLVGALLIASIISAHWLQAASVGGSRSLKGLTTIRIVVEDLNRDAQETGLRKEQLYALAAQQLAKDGLTVIKPQEHSKVPIVYIRLSSIIARTQTDVPVSFYLNVQVKQLATLTQGLSGTCQAGGEPVANPFLVTTWEKGSMAMVERSQLRFYTQQILSNLLGDLVIDQKEANDLAPAG